MIDKRFLAIQDAIGIEKIVTRRSANVFQAAVYLYEQFGGTIRPYSDFSFHNRMHRLNSPLLSNDLLFEGLEDGNSVSELTQDKIHTDAVTAVQSHFRTRDKGYVFAHAHYLQWNKPDSFFQNFNIFSGLFGQETFEEATRQAIMAPHRKIINNSSEQTQYFI